MTQETLVLVLAWLSTQVAQFFLLARLFIQRKVTTRLPGYKAEVLQLGTRQVLIISLAEQEQDTVSVPSDGTPTTPASQV